MSFGLLVIIIALVILSFDRLFSPKDTYYIAFTDQSLSGIDIGSQVKYLGIPVGTVRNLRINPGNINEIPVRNRAKIANTLDELNITVRYLIDTARSIHNDPSGLIRGRRYNNVPDERLIE